MWKNYLIRYKKGAPYLAKICRWKIMFSYCDCNVVYIFDANFLIQVS